MRLSWTGPRGCFSSRFDRTGVADQYLAPPVAVQPPAPLGSDVDAAARNPWEVRATIK